MNDVESSQNYVVPPNDLVPAIGTIDSNYQISNKNVGE